MKLNDFEKQFNGTLTHAISSLEFAPRTASSNGTEGVLTLKDRIRLLLSFVDHGGQSTTLMDNLNGTPSTFYQSTIGFTFSDGNIAGGDGPSDIGHNRYTDGTSVHQNIDLKSIKPGAEIILDQYNIKQIYRKIDSDFLDLTSERFRTTNFIQRIDVIKTILDAAQIDSGKISIQLFPDKANQSMELIFDIGIKNGFQIETQFDDIKKTQIIIDIDKLNRFYQKYEITDDKLLEKFKQKIQKNEDLKEQVAKELTQLCEITNNPQKIKEGIINLNFSEEKRYHIFSEINKDFNFKELYKKGLIDRFNDKSFLYHTLISHSFSNHPKNTDISYDTIRVHTYGINGQDNIEQATIKEAQRIQSILDTHEKSIPKEVFGISHERVSQGNIDVFFKTIAPQITEIKSRIQEFGIDNVVFCNTEADAKKKTYAHRSIEDINQNISGVNAQFRTKSIPKNTI